MDRFRIGVDSYGLNPLGLDPLQTLRWAKAHGAEGVHFSGLEARHLAIVDTSYLRDLAAWARENNLYLEWGGGQHIPREAGSWARKELFAINRLAAEQAEIIGTRIVRSCSGGLIRWRSDSPMTETLLQETAEALLAQKRMLTDHNAILAIETHFEFTSFEQVRLLERCQAAPGEWLGICLDTMNLLIMLEDPVWATRRLLPWVVSTHVKDGGVVLAPEGLRVFPVAMGNGVVDIPAILTLLKSLSAGVALSIEGHGGSFSAPIFDPDFLTKFPDLTAGELSRLIKLAFSTNAKSASGCRMVNREDWPGVCAKRMAADIDALRTIASPFA